MTEIPFGLITAYKATNFTVLEPRAFTLRIGQHSAELQALYVELGVSSAGYLTAWNPFSKVTSEVDNKNAHRQLLRKLSLEGFPTLNAMGVNPGGEWPGEESVFVPGLSLDQAKLLGTEFGQNAIVWADADAVPQLILLR
jgi:hypothetical protein